MATPKTEAVEKVTSTERPQRKERTPVSGPRDILTVSNKDPNYVYRWVKDLPGRIQRFVDAGYETVVHETEVGMNAVDRASRLGSAVTRLDGANTLVLMRILKEWYNEDQLAKQVELDAMEQLLYEDGLKPVRRDLGGTTPSEQEQFRKAK